MFISWDPGRLLRNLQNPTAAPCVTLQATGSYKICFHVERAVETLSLGQSCQIIDGWHSMPVAGQAPLAVLTSITP